MAHSSSSSATGERKRRRSVDTRSSCSKMAHSSLSSARNSMWSKMSDCLAGKRANHTAVAYRDAMYVFGGFNGSTNLNNLISFGVKDKSWKPVHATGTPPEPREGHSAVVFGNSMFIFGGRTSNDFSDVRNDLFEYDFQKAMWVQWTSNFFDRTPKPRSDHGAAVYDNKMWIFAGCSCSWRLCLDDMWALNLTEASHWWEEVKQKGERPPARCYSSVVVARDCMYVFSGKGDRETTTNNFLFEFNFKTKTWRRIGNEYGFRGVASQSPSKRYGHTLVHHDRFLYVFGGSDGSTLLNEMHCYDLDFQNWSIIQPYSIVPSGRAFHSSIILNNAIYIYGGKNALSIDKKYTVLLDDFHCFQLPSYPKCTLRDDYGKFFSEKQFCDIKFIVGPEEKKIVAHIALVAARSKYLRTKILAARDARQQQVGGCSQGANQESLLEVRLPNANAEAFEIILNYIYSDRIYLKESSKTNIIILITDIHQLADLFLMPGLVPACIKCLDCKINKQNVLKGLCYADKKKIQIVKDHCMNFLIKEENFADVVMSKEFSDLDKPLAVEITRKKLNPGKILAHPIINKEVGTTLESDMAVFLESTGRDFCDIELVLDGQVIMAHKSILAARTQYFESMFRSFPPPDNTVNISIGDIIPSREALQSLLRYIYYGDIELPPQDALYLLQAHNIYGLSNNRLNSSCKYSLDHRITCENVLQTLEAANHAKIFVIKEYPLKPIANDFAHLLKISDHLRELLLEIIRAEESCSSINTD